jgi:hypothetical protein
MCFIFYHDFILKKRSKVKNLIYISYMILIFMSNIFYIYRHIRLDKNIPFHIGKGSGNRAFSKYNRNKYWHNIVNKVGYKVEIIIHSLEEKQAFAKEIEFIKLYKSMGYCETNLTNGGEGGSGCVRSEETKKRVGDAKRGIPSPKRGKSYIKQSICQLGSKNHMYGKPNPRRLQVINIITNKIFDSIKEAAKDSNISYRWLRDKLKTGHANQQKYSNYFYLKDIKN